MAEDHKRLIGKRVELPVFSEEWNKGDRYGIVHDVLDGDSDTPVLHIVTEQGLSPCYFRAQDVSEAPREPQL